MPKILFLYFSGTGSTKVVSEQLAAELSHRGEDIELVDIDMNTDPAIVEPYDFLIIGTPTYHNYPPQTLVEFVDRFSWAKPSKRCYLFATYGLYPGNNLRRLAKQLETKNIQTIGHSGFRSPASDGTLMFPAWLRFMYRFELRIAEKIETCAKTIVDLAKRVDAPARRPPYKWYAPLDYIPNKVFTEPRFRHKLAPQLHVIPERWDGKPIDCPRGCWDTTKEVPVIAPENCDFCLRCVHRTANQAVCYSPKMKNRERLSPAFFERLKAGFKNK